MPPGKTATKKTYLVVVWKRFLSCASKIVTSSLCDNLNINVHPNPNL